MVGENLTEKHREDSLGYEESMVGEKLTKNQREDSSGFELSIQTRRDFRLAVASIIWCCRPDSAHAALVYAQVRTTFERTSEMTTTTTTLDVVFLNSVFFLNKL